MHAGLILVALLCRTFLKDFATTSRWNAEYSLSYAHCKFYIMQSSDEIKIWVQFATKTLFID